MPRTSFLAVALLALPSARGSEGSPPAAYHPPPGAYRTSWVGNSFPGDGGPNGFGYWVQNGADEIEVTPDGTVIAGTDWDEAGRCAGLYKDGKVNRVLLKQEGKAKETAWGWNTGNRAVAVDGPDIFIANTGKRLLRFAWTPGDIDSARFLSERDLPDVAVGLHARGGALAVAYAKRIELRRGEGLEVASAIEAEDVKDVTTAPDGAVWVLDHRARSGRIPYPGASRRDGASGGATGGPEGGDLARRKRHETEPRGRRMSASASSSMIHAGRIA